MEDTYLTIAETSEGLYKEKGSKFLAFAYPVKTEEEVKMHLENLSKKYYDARHHCYAYLLGDNPPIYRAYDDGEPNHSAGDPILGQIRSRNLTDVLVVVVRYFGGTKLGVGGLVSAYKTAASLALDTNRIQTVIRKEIIRLRYEYQDTAEVMRLINQLEVEIISQDFREFCTASLSCRLKNVDIVQAELKANPSVTIID
ncbi:MAG: YigZ family protein [Lunatimonas sp.]|uniref:IMPACT family protein n=1 Tax=Lunatimonas sp. TaxID=2060141 RepID=UPI00263AB2E6|nr:YigZ family protein [Lunatimonas sp.]MCC5938745.1 YigZ family protein [Lunatimonas sp.]